MQDPQDGLAPERIRALEESAARYRTLVDSAPVCIHEIDLNGRLISMNPAGLEMIGAADETAVRGNPYLDSAAPDDRARLAALMRAAFAGQAAQFEFDSADGALRFSSSFIPVRDADDQVVRLMGITRDVTDRRRVERSLQHRVRFEELISTISTRFLRAGPGQIDVLLHETLRTVGEFVEVDRAYISLRADGARAGREWVWGREGISPAALSPVPSWTAPLPGGEPVFAERTEELPEATAGQRAELLARGVRSCLVIPLESADGAIGVLGFDVIGREQLWDAHDRRLLRTVAEIFGYALGRQHFEETRERNSTHRRALVAELEATNTELAASNAELKLTNAELERFVYSASHDLKSPLITIRGFLGAIQEDLGRQDFERLAADLQIIDHASGRMASLLDGLLDLSRIGRVIRPPESVPLAVLVEEALEQTAGQLAAHNVVVDVGPDLPDVFVDPERFVEVLQNLLVNAATYMGDQAAPRVEIHGEETVAHTRVIVADNGIGIEPRYQEKVFGLFERLDASTPGTGIGLALVRRIADGHGGRAWVESPGRGQGARFVVELPRPRD